MYQSILHERSTKQSYIIQSFITLVKDSEVDGILLISLKASPLQQVGISCFCFDSSLSQRFQTSNRQPVNS